MGEMDVKAYKQLFIMCTAAKKVQGWEGFITYICALNKSGQMTSQINLIGTHRSYKRWTLES